ncbi:unnamed protein product [Prorocentrum cordatum]|uniref:Uncharacterized protein n=1 Tax=Prorocentrum cordatum TaxID=2364126 RepID=A0ABN9V3J5_9DINO|nr:unnamed protein product [Polarella glacialis]
MSLAEPASPSFAAGASRLLVTHVLARAMVEEPKMRDALAQELGALARQSAECSEAAARRRALQLQAESVARSAALSRELRRVLYAHVFAGAIFHASAGFCSSVVARSYRRASRKRLDEDEQLLPLVLRACGPADWARCAAACRALRARGIGGPGLAAYWFRSHSREGHREALQLVVQRGAADLLVCPSPRRGQT